MMMYLSFSLSHSASLPLPFLFSPTPFSLSISVSLILSYSLLVFLSITPFLILSLFHSPSLSQLFPTLPLYVCVSPSLSLCLLQYPSLTLCLIYISLSHYFSSCLMLRLYLSFSLPLLSLFATESLSKSLSANFMLFNVSAFLSLFF